MASSKRLLVGGHAGVLGGNRFCDGENRVRQGGTALDRKTGFARAVDGDRQDRQAEGAHCPEVGRGDVAGSGVAGGGPAWDVDEDAAVFEVGLELGAGVGGGGVVGGKHRTGAGFFEIGPQRGIVLGVLFDEPGDFAPGEEFFEQEELFEIEAAGNDEGSGGRDAILVEDLVRCGGHWGKFLVAESLEASLHGHLRGFSPASHGFSPGIRPLREPRSLRPLRR